MAERALQKLLIIDDDNDLLRILELVFKAHPNIQVRCHHTSEEGIQVALTDPPDCILLDVMMPGNSGIDVLHTLQKFPKLQNTAIIFLTAKVQEHEIEELRKEGAFAVITKPFEANALPQKLQDIWQRFIQQK